METVFVGMSGGIDSSFAAHILKQKGYNVIGITFQMLPEGIKSIENPGVCCSFDSVNRAKNIASDLSIPHYVIDLREEFMEYVVQNFINEYKAGRTPNPCVLCNRYIKFSSFLTKALSMGAEKIATGHYAIIEEKQGRYLLKKSFDRTKDQSYFLYPIKSDLLKYILFPVGLYRKGDVRDMAREKGWDISNFRESQDICFIPDNDYRAFLADFINLREGPIYLNDGRLIGHHNGIHLYTIGQRRGLNIPYKEALYVIKILHDENSLIVGPKEYLGCSLLTATDVNLLTQPEDENIKAKVRYRQKEEPCRYTYYDNTLTVEFDNPVYSVTPGQSVCIYNKDIVVGGGIIKETKSC